MTLHFELSIWLSGDTGTWTDNHRFPGRPDVETIKLLMQNARETYEVLYGGEANNHALTLDYMEAEDSEASVKSFSRTDM